MRIISGKARGTKLYTLKGLKTRPTLDRVKESLFNIIQYKLIDSTILDMFSGSGALGIESLSRGAKKAILCDCNYDAINIIKKNVEKCHFKNSTEIICKDYKKCLETIKEKIDIIFLDPPYEKNIAIQAVEKIIEKDILNQDGLIIIETDNEQREIEQLRNIKNITIQDIRRYGKVKLLFISRKEEL